MHSRLLYKSPTISIGIYHKDVELNDMMFRIKLYDTGIIFILKYFKLQVNCYMMIFDVSDRESLKIVIDWYESFIRQYEKNNFKFVLVGNKCELYQRISIEEIYTIAEKHGLEYFDVSSKLNVGINEVFEHIISCY